MDVKQQHTYILYTVKEGVFYVGIGDDKRLRETVKPRKSRYHINVSTKYQEIERRQADGQEILLDVVFSSYARPDVEQCERGLIACYGPALTNYIYKDTERTSSWLPIGMKYQKFPIPDCPECMRLWQICATLDKANFMKSFLPYDRERTPEEIAEREKRGDAHVQYAEHKQTHPQIIPK